MKRIENENAFRDPNSGGVVFDGPSQRSQIEARKKMKNRLKEQDERINNIEKEINENKKMLRKILNHLEE